MKYFLKKKSSETGPRPLWKLTCHGDDNCPATVSGDISFEELRLQAYEAMWGGQTVQQMQEREKQLE